VAEPLPKRDNRDRRVSFRDRGESAARPLRVRAETLTGVGTVRHVRRTGPIVATALLVLGTLVASSAAEHVPAPAPVIDVTPGPGATLPSDLTLTIGPLPADACDERM
jgi:hypothetical protein